MTEQTLEGSWNKLAIELQKIGLALKPIRKLIDEEYLSKQKVREAIKLMDRRIAEFKWTSTRATKEIFKELGLCDEEKQSKQKTEQSTT